MWIAVKEAVWWLLRKCGTGPLLLRVHPKSFLRQVGWFRSFRARRSCDTDGNPLPWWTYAAVAFVDERVTREMRVLEYGGGASTIWFAARVAEVVTLENNPVWARMLEKQVPANASVRYVKDMEVFDATMDGDLGKFHIVIIDCLANRIACAKKGLEFLREDGCIIWDDTNGPDWPAIQQLMEEYGFRSISFSGMTPQEVAGGRTTVFYRQDNSFGV